MTSHRFCVAPMIDWTDRHCRYFHRLLTQQALLYTEMITTGAILHGDRDKLLFFNPEENPVALQLGGSEPKALAACAKIGEDYGYNEINLNIGCPSDRVQQGRFGACLMAEPNLVADCITAINAAVSLPVTIKTRIGIDHSSVEFLWEFIQTLKKAGCKTFIIHARKAWLQGLSPKQNREIPPLDYSLVYQLKKDFPELNIILNGGIQNLADAQQHLSMLDGVMLGRAAYHQPYLLNTVDQQIFNLDKPPQSRAEILARLIPYWQKEMQHGVALHTMSRHILGLWHGESGSRKIRQILSDSHCSAEKKLQFLLNIVNTQSD
jgi:tRNA-dihydrouridine synthase A